MEYQKTTKVFKNKNDKEILRKYLKKEIYLHKKDITLLIISDQL